MEQEASAFNNIIINNDSTANNTSTNDIQHANKPDGIIVTEKCKPSDNEICKPYEIDSSNIVQKN